MRAELANEVRQCSVRSGAPGNSPAVPSASWSSQKKSGSAQCDLELSDAVRQCSVRSVLFPFQVLSSRLKSCLSFEVRSLLFSFQGFSFRVLSFVGSPLFVSNPLFSFEVLSFVSSPLFRFKSFLLVGNLAFCSKSPLFVSRPLFCFEFSLSLEVLSSFQGVSFVSNSLFR